jgi:hypothetical protein
MKQLCTLSSCGEGYFEKKLRKMSRKGWFGLKFSMKYGWFRQAVSCPICLNSSLFYTYFTLLLLIFSFSKFSCEMLGVFSTIRIRNEKRKCRPIGNKESKNQQIEYKYKKLFIMWNIKFCMYFAIFYHIHGTSGKFEWIWY